MLIACSLGAAQETESPEERARAAWQLGYLLHLYGEYERAIERFRESISIHPTAEAHTFLGWSLSRLGKLEEAIAQCKNRDPARTQRLAGFVASTRPSR